VSAVLSLTLYPGIWKEDFAVYANGRMKDKTNYVFENFYYGGMFFALIPLGNILFAGYSLLEFFLYRRWKSDGV
jgi:hypothetical protein